VLFLPCLTRGYWSRAIICGKTCPHTEEQWQILRVKSAERQAVPTDVLQILAYGIEHDAFDLMESNETLRRKQEQKEQISKTNGYWSRCPLPYRAYVAKTDGEVRPEEWPSCANDNADKFFGQEATAMISLLNVQACSAFWSLVSIFFTSTSPGFTWSRNQWYFTA
jgi:hypothetical protein